MSWEQHRYAIERAARELRSNLEKAEEANGGAIGIMLALMAGHEDAQMLDDVADFLAQLDATARGGPPAKAPPLRT